METDPEGFAVDGGAAIDLPSWQMRVKVPAEATGGRLTVIHGRMGPLVTGPPAHVHDGHDETFLVLAGRLRFRLGDDHHDVAAGGTVYAPRGLAHGFANIADEPALYLAVVSPSGYEDYFGELEAHLSGTGEMPDTATTRRLMAKYATRLASYGPEPRTVPKRTCCPRPSRKPIPR